MDVLRECLEYYLVSFVELYDLRKLNIANRYRRVLLEDHTDLLKIKSKVLQSANNHRLKCH